MLTRKHKCGFSGPGLGNSFLSYAIANVNNKRKKKKGKLDLIGTKHFCASKNVKKMKL